MARPVVEPNGVETVPPTVSIRRTSLCPLPATYTPPVPSVASCADDDVGNVAVAAGPSCLQAACPEGVAGIDLPGFHAGAEPAHTLRRTAVREAVGHDRAARLTLQAIVADRGSGGQGFLDVAGRWDPSLAFVMGGAIAVGLVAFAIARRRTVSLLGLPMRMPTATAIDARLVAGSAMFGVGWGLAGLCPGPALVALGAGYGKAAVFVLAMLAGMGIFEGIERVRARVSATGRKEGVA